jgi:hypothetical protein
LGVWSEGCSGGPCFVHADGGTASGAPATNVTPKYLPANCRA